MKSVRYHIFESLHAGFNAKAGTYGVSTGNVNSGTQLSNYVRSYDDCEHNGKTDYEPGHLQRFDLDTWQNCPLDPLVAEWMQDHRREKVIIYCIRHHRGERRIIHGWIITGQHPDHELKECFYGRGTKNGSIIDEAIKFVAGNHRPYSADIICDDEDEVKKEFSGRELEVALQCYRGFMPDEL